MKARLFRTGHPDEPFEFGSEATIGRRESNSFALEARAVSGEHARIRFDAERGRYVLEDLGSLNGTRLDGVAVTRPEPLDRLHVLEFGGEGPQYVFQALDLSPEEPEPAPQEMRELPAGTAVEQEMPELPPALADDSAPDAAAPPGAGTATDREMPPVPADLLAAIDGEAEETVPVAVEREIEAPPPPAPDPSGDAPFYLQFHEPPGAEPIALAPGERVVGRARSADISVESSSVSRRHALLSIGERVTVKDLGSRNHTFVDGERVAGEVEVPPGAQLRFGGLTATLRAGSQSP